MCQYQGVLTHLGSQRNSSQTWTANHVHPHRRAERFLYIWLIFVSIFGSRSSKPCSPPPQSWKISFVFNQMKLAIGTGCALYFKNTHYCAVFDQKMESCCGKFKVSSQMHQSEFCIVFDQIINKHFPWQHTELLIWWQVKCSNCWLHKGQVHHTCVFQNKRRVDVWEKLRLVFSCWWLFANVLWM